MYDTASNDSDNSKILLMECCDVKVSMEEIKHIFQLIHLSASQVQCVTHSRPCQSLACFKGRELLHS